MSLLENVFRWSLLVIGIVLIIMMALRIFGVF